MLLAFHNDETIKNIYLARVKKHRELDELIKGKYWKNGKGCAVGCTIHSDNHNAYEKELGIPEWLARIEDKIFEGLPAKRSQDWPEEFLSAIKVGADLEKIKAPFLIFVLESTLDKFNHKKYPEVKTAIDNVIALWKKSGATKKEFKAAAVAATDAATYADAAAAVAAATYADAAAAVAAATYAADAAAAVAATDAATYAYAAANAAAYAAAAYAAANAAAYAAANAAADVAYAAAYAAVRQTMWIKFADELLRLLKECK